MKKIMLAITAITLSFCLAACGKGATATTITSLANQLDKTSNTVSEVSVVSPTEISLESSQEEDLSKDIKQTQDCLLGEQYYRTKILEKTAHIKSKMAKDAKLSKAETAALKDLVLSLNKYTNLVSESKGEMSSAAKSISSMKKDVSKNRERISAKVNRLVCNSNMRSAYYENILNTLDEIDCYFEEENTTESPQVEEKEQKSSFTLTKNIDTYRNEEETKSNLPPENTHTINRYGYGRWNRFNPMRNTDTYGPTFRNIDGYGMYGYGYGYPGYYGRTMMPMGPNGMYGSNYYNRATTPNFGAMPVNVETEDKETPLDNEKKCENCEQSVLAHNVVKKVPKQKDDRVVIAH